MSKQNGGGEDGRKVVGRNRKARHEYQILDTYEAGIVLKGPEVKSLRAGQLAFRDAFARVESGEVWLYHLHISPYEEANRAKRSLIVYVSCSCTARRSAVW